MLLSFLDNDFNLKMVASTAETSFNKISFNQKNFHVLLFIYRLKLKQFEKLNGNKKSFKLMKLHLIILLILKIIKIIIDYFNQTYFN